MPCVSVEVLTSCWSLFHLNVTLALKGWNLESVGVFCQFQRCQDSLIVLPGKNHICICVCLFTCRISEESRFSLIMLASKNCRYIFFSGCICVWLFSTTGFVVDGAAVGGYASCLGCCFPVWLSAAAKGTAAASVSLSAYAESLKTRTMSTFLPL